MEDGELTARVATELSDHADQAVFTSVAGPGDRKATPMTDRRAALGELMDAYGKIVLGFCLRMLRDRELANDVMQQVFLEAYRDFDRFQGRSSPRTWLLAIANNRCLDALRSKRRHEKRLVVADDEVAALEAPSPGPAEHVDHVQLGTALESCLSLLSPEVRATVLLRYQTGLGYRELAEMLGVSADALQVRVSRALPVLRRCMERKGWSGD